MIDEIATTATPRLVPGRIAALLCVLSWGTHFVSVGLSSIRESTLGLRMTGCFITCAIGASFCFLVHLHIGRRATAGGLRLFARAVAICSGFALLHTVMDRYIYASIWSGVVVDMSQWWSSSALLGRFIALEWIYVAWSGLYATNMVASLVRVRDQQLATAAFAAQRAQLQALRLQVSPHFLFNTLNTISGLIVLRRLDDCERVILNLSGFLRTTLASDVDREIALVAEIESVFRYLDIERVRYAERLVVSCHIDDDARSFPIPELILLPLVENAVKYSSDSPRRQVHVTLRAETDGERVRIAVEDDGGRVTGNRGRTGFGIGLNNVRLRLETLYGSDAELQAGPTTQGWRSVLLIPRRSADHAYRHS